MDNLKDNPVPSLDLTEQFDLFINNEFGEPTGDQVYFINKFKKWFNKQNGVETNKEQPSNFFEDTDMDY
jgi:hypothetical protein